MRRKKKKQFTVLVDMTYSLEYNVSAYTRAEARKKAFAKFIKAVPRQKKCFSIYEDLID